MRTHLGCRPRRGRLGLLGLVAGLGVLCRLVARLRRRCRLGRLSDERHSTARRRIAARSAAATGSMRVVDIRSACRRGEACCGRSAPCSLDRPIDATRMRATPCAHASRTRPSCLLISMYPFEYISTGMLTKPGCVSQQGGVVAGANRNLRRIFLQFLLRWLCLGKLTQASALIKLHAALSIYAPMCRTKPYLYAQARAHICSHACMHACTLAEAHQGTCLHMPMSDRPSLRHSARGYRLARLLCGLRMLRCLTCVAHSPSRAAEPPLSGRTRCSCATDSASRACERLTKLLRLDWRQAEAVHELIALAGRMLA